MNVEPLLSLIKGNTMKRSNDRLFRANKQKIHASKAVYKILFLSIIGNIILSVLFNNAHLYESGIFMYGSIALLTCFLFFFSNNCSVICLNKNEILWICVYLFGQIISVILVMVHNEPVSWDVHRIIIFVLLYLTFFCTFRNGIISLYDFEKILRCLLITGIISFIYDVLINGDALQKLITDIMYLKYNGSKFTSFFLTRTVCAYHSFLCCNVAVYFLSRKRKVKYFLFVIMLFIHCLLTNARMPIVMSAISLIVAFIFDRNLRRYLRWILFFFIIYFVVNIEDIVNVFNEIIIPIFTHSTSGINTSTARFSSWYGLISNSKGLFFLFGHGMGSQTVLANYYDSRFHYLGYHSMFVDAFCQGGILLVFLMLLSIIKSVQRVVQSNVSVSIKTFSIALTIGYLGIMLTDSVGAVFDFQSMSLISTALIIGLPCLYQNSNL